MSQQHQDPDTPTKQAQTTPLPSYESALHLPADTISFTLARLKTIDRLFILLICSCILCLLFLNCSFALLFSTFFCSLMISLFVSWLELLLWHYFCGFLHAVHALSLLLKSTVVPMVLMFNLCLHEKFKR